MNQALILAALSVVTLAGCSSGGSSSSTPPVNVPTQAPTTTPTTKPSPTPSPSATAVFGPLTVVLADVDNAQLVPIDGGLDTRVHYVSNGPLLVTQDGYVAFAYVFEPANTSCELDLFSGAPGFSATQHFDSITPPPPGATTFQHQVATFIAPGYVGSTTVTAQLVCGGTVSKRYAGPLTKV